MSRFPRPQEEFPRLGGEETPLKHRRRVIIMAIFYAAVTVICVALTIVAIYKLAGGDGGFVIMLSIFGFFGLIFGYWALHYLRDMSAAPVTYEGTLMKKWHKGNLFVFFMPSFYIYVSQPNYMQIEAEGGRAWGKIFTIKRQDYAMLLESDLVRVRCYPHSLLVEQMERYDESDKRFIPAASGAND
jgi:hypothetical protein